MNIDIIIPTYKRPQQVKNLCTALKKQTKDGDVISVVWQVRREFAEYRIEGVRNLLIPFPGLPRARNHGIANTNNEIILFLDDDIIPDDNLLEAHRRIHLRGKYAIVAGSMTDLQYPSHQNSFVSAFDSKTGELIQNFDIPRDCEVICARGANFSMRRSVFSRTPLFDTHFTGNALWEDVDWCFEALREGFRIWFHHRAHCVHAQSPEGGCRSHSSGAYMYHQYKNTAYFAGKHMPRTFTRSWIRFWKYRLEYDTRWQGPILRHNLVLIICALAGAITGAIVFRIRWHRRARKIPDITRVFSEKIQ